MKLFSRMNFAKAGLMGVAFAVLAGCASSLKPSALDLGPSAGRLGVRLAWTKNVGLVDFPVSLNASAGALTAANSKGDVVALDVKTGAELWRASLGVKLSAGVGSDGRISAVVSRDNELIVLELGREVWRQKLVAQVFTAPLVAGGRIFVLAADRSVAAFDAQSGRKIWQLQRPGESLVLRQPGVLLAVGDTLVAGLSGQLVSINPGNGSVRRESTVASPRGTNDIERLVDLVGPASRDGDLICARAFQSALGCADAVTGRVLWTKPASGAVGLQGDESHIYGAESDGKLIAWRRTDGERVWTSERLRFRVLTAPVVVGRAVAVGDDTGFIHWLSRDDGAPLAHLKTDGSAIVTAPVLASGTLFVLTQSGGIFGFLPE